MTANVGAEELLVALEGADAARAALREKQAREQMEREKNAAEEARKCENAFRLEAQLQEWRERGMDVPYSPEIDGAASECGMAQAEKNGAGASAERNEDSGYHALIFHPLTGYDTSVYIAKLVAMSGCVRSVREIESYVAEHNK